MTRLKSFVVLKEDTSQIIIEIPKGNEKELFELCKYLNQASDLEINTELLINCLITKIQGRIIAKLQQTIDNTQNT